MHSTFRIVEFQIEKSEHSITVLKDEIFHLKNYDCNFWKQNGNDITNKISISSFRKLTTITSNFVNMNFYLKKISTTGYNLNYLYEKRYSVKFRTFLICYQYL